MIQIENLSFALDDEKIITNFSHTFPVGKITGILAPVEERVSFLLKIISGIIEPQEGSALVDGVDLFNGTPDDIREVRKTLSFVFDRGGLLSNLSVLENLILPMDFYFPDMSHEEKLEKISWFFHYFSLNSKLLTERPAKLHPQISKMMLLIRAFLPDPKIILYDNPLGDLEQTFKKKIFAYISELKKRKLTQVFVSTSDILFELSDDNLVFKSGDFVESGSWEELMFSESPITQKLIKEYLEVGINEA